MHPHFQERSPNVFNNFIFNNNTRQTNDTNTIQTHFSQSGQREQKIVPETCQRAPKNNENLINTEPIFNSLEKPSISSIHPRNKTQRIERLNLDKPFEYEKYIKEKPVASNYFHYKLFDNHGEHLTLDGSLSFYQNNKVVELFKNDIEEKSRYKIAKDHIHDNLDIEDEPVSSSNCFGPKSILFLTLETKFTSKDRSFKPY